MFASQEETKNDLKEFCQVIFSDSTAWLRRRTSRDSQSDSSSRSSSSIPGAGLTTRGASCAFAANPFLQRHAAPSDTAETSSAACRGAHGEPRSDEVPDNLPAWRYGKVTIGGGAAVAASFSADGFSSVVFLGLQKYSEKRRMRFAFRKDPILYQHVLLILATDESFLSDPETPDTSTHSKDRHNVEDTPSAISLSMPSEQKIQEYAMEPRVADAFIRLGGSLFPCA